MKGLKKPNWNHLLQNLRQFGLNPQDWEAQTAVQLAKADPYVVELRHRQDPEWRLRGQIAHQGHSSIWTELKVVSL